MTQVAVLNLNTDLSLCLMVVTGLARDILAGVETWYLRLAMMSANTELSSTEQTDIRPLGHTHTHSDHTQP